MNEKLRQEIAGYFISDSSDYLNRYSILINKGNFTHIGNRSKILIDLLFSYECSLKVLIFLESSDDEKATYSKIKKCSHSIDKLLHHVDKTPIIAPIITFIEQNNLAALSVAYRYTLEANRALREDTGALGRKYYSTVSDPQWIKEVYAHADELHDYVCSKSAPITVISLQNIDVQEELDNWMLLRNIDK